MLATEAAVHSVSSIGGLTRLGIAPEVVRRWLSMFSRGCDTTLADVPLTELQEKALNHPDCLAGRRNLLIAGPTSTGKTLVAEAMIANTISRPARRKALYLVPLRALVTEKVLRFRELFNDHVIVAASSDYVSSDRIVRSGDWDLTVVVFDKAYQWLAREEMSRRLLRDLDLVVVDEVQLLEQQQRGEKLEGLVTFFRFLQRGAPGWAGFPPPRIVMMGAREAAEPLAAWLDAVIVPDVPVGRPIPLFEGWVEPGGRSRVFRQAIKRESFQKGEMPLAVERVLTDLPRARDPDALAVELVSRLVNERLRTIVYARSKHRAEELARRFKNSLGKEKLDPGVVEVLDELDESSAREALAQTLRGRVGFHHGDMLRSERSLVEEAFSAPGDEPLVHTVVATPTLGMGVNLPADVVLMLDTVTYQGRDQGDTEPTRPLTALEYHNYAGRAGRYSPCAGDGRFGLALAIRTNDSAPTVDAWLHGEIAPLQAALARPACGLVPHLLSLLAAVLPFQQDDGDVIELALALMRSSYRFVVSEEAALEEDVRAAIADMQRARMIVRGRLTGFGRAAARHHFSVDSMLMLRELAGQLLALMPRHPLDVLVALCRMPEIDGSYPPSSRTPGADHDIAGEHRDCALMTGHLQEFLLHQVPEHLYRDNSPFHRVTARTVDQDDPCALDELRAMVRTAAAWGWSRGMTMRNLATYFPRLSAGAADDLGRRLAAAVETLNDVFQLTTAIDVDADVAKDVGHLMHVWAHTLRYGVRQQLVPLEMALSEVEEYQPSRKTLWYVLTAANGADDLRCLRGQPRPRHINETAWRAVQRALDWWQNETRNGI